MLTANKKINSPNYTNHRNCCTWTALNPSFFNSRKFNSSNYIPIPIAEYTSIMHAGLSQWLMTVSISTLLYPKLQAHYSNNPLQVSNFSTNIRKILQTRILYIQHSMLKTVFEIEIQKQEHNQVCSQRWVRIENFPKNFHFGSPQTNFSGFKK